MPDDTPTKVTGRRLKNPESPHAMQELKQIRPGLAIYRIGASPYWYARWYHPTERKHIVRSTKETSRIEARKAAEELAASYVAQMPKIEKQHLFGHWVKVVDKHNERRGKQNVTNIDRTTMFNPDKGLEKVFGKRDIRTITASQIKDYLFSLDEGRAKPLSRSSKVKYLATLKKVLTAAAEDGVLTSIPTFPQIEEKNEARVSFTDDEYKHLLKVARHKDKHLYNMISFLVGSFLRPVESELFALKNKDITEKDDPQSLHLAIRGKTGERVTATMPHCASIWKAQLKLTGAKEKDDYVFFPGETNRKRVIFRAIAQFNSLLDEAGLKNDALGRPRSLYSLRHRAIQDRIVKSGGKVNIYSLAKNAGTSVEMLQNHYLKHMSLTDDLVRNLHADKDD